jgi:RNA polymerase sigma-70 factor (ECF subfamily)
LDFIQAVSRAPRGPKSEGSVKRFGTWLVAILRRKIADHYRKCERSPDLDAQPLGEHGPFTAQGKWSTSSTNWRMTPKDAAESAEFWAVFQRCLAGLPGHMAQAFRLRELNQASVDEATQLVGVTSQNLAVRLHRARLLLRECLEKN